MKHTYTASFALASDARELLAKICGLFGSRHDGERAAAAAKADQLVRSCGLTWPDVIWPQGSSETPEAQIGMALANLDALTRWERGFIYSINGRQTLSEKQLGTLHKIAAKVRAYREGRQ